MRVLSVGNLYPPHHLGGYELVWRSAVAALRAAGHEVRVLTTDYRSPAVTSAEVERDVYRELRWYWRDHAFPRLSIRERLRLERHNSERLQRHLSEFEPDVATWWAMGGMSLSLIAQCARAGVPAVAFVHDDWLIYGPDVDAWLRLFKHVRPVGRMVDRLSGLPTAADPADVSRWLFVSATARDAALAKGWRLPGTAILPSGVDSSFLVDVPDRRWSWHLLYVGRIDPRKGVDTAVEALTMMPSEARLSIVGDGDEREIARLRQQIDRLDLTPRIELLGPRPRAQVRELYGAADAVLFPVRWSEPWGLVPLEAMAVGRPVVASGRGGSGEYLRDEVNCLLFDVEDPPSLARAVGRLASDPELRARLRAGGRDTARRHTDDRFCAAVVEAVESASARSLQPLDAG